MAIIISKPTSPGRRGQVRIKHDHIHAGGPHQPLTERLQKTSGRNNYGRITVRHKGGSFHTKIYRQIDFKRDKYDIEGRVERIEYDPNRSALIALILYKDGERRYIIAPQGLIIGDIVSSGEKAAIKTGNSLPLKNIPVGTTIHMVEIKPGKGAQLLRSAGSSGQLVAKDGTYAIIRLRSGEMRKILLSCAATVGVVSNSEHNLKKIGKAGAMRWRGIRPTVRGVAMNPVDHPHGGGEGKTSAGRHPVSPWGTPTKGYKTRNNKRTDAFILRRKSTNK
jgi:large subunit ribosomal protein L2